MAAKPKSKKVEEIAKDFHNEVHDRLELLFKEFSEERRKGIKDKFEEVVAYPAIDILREIVGSEGLDTEEKLAALSRVYEAASQMAYDLQQPELSTVFWKDRPKEQKYADPCQWVIDNYPSYDNGLTLNMLTSHDPELYNLLRKKKSAGKWLPDFKLPTQAEANTAAIVKNGGIPTLSEIAEVSPPHVRELLRLFEVGKNRRRKEHNTTINRSSRI